MVRKLTLVFIVVLGVVAIPGLSAQGATTTPPLRRVDGLLDRSLKELRAAEQFADQRHLGRIDRSTDQAIRLARAAEQTVDRALAMVRRAGSQKLTRAQGEQIEQLITQAQRQLRQAEAMIDHAAQQSEDHKRLREMLARIDRQVDEALKLLRQAVAGL